jgi:hypothetical protein
VYAQTQLACGCAWRSWLADTAAQVLTPTTHISKPQAQTSLLCHPADISNSVPLPTIAASCPYRLRPYTFWHPRCPLVQFTPMLTKINTAALHVAKLHDTFLSAEDPFRTLKVC